MASDDLYTGPTVLAPGATDYSRRVAPKLLIPLSVMLFLVVLLFYVFFTVFAVKGPSMQPTLLDEDRVLVTKSYETPQRGDIVVFKTLDEFNREEELIKRVIGVPGDTVEVRQGIALVNGVVESTHGIETSPDDRTYVSPTVIPDDHVFVMGDNRPVALDSRQLGPVPTFSVEGKAVFVYAPVNRMGPLP